MKLGCFILGFLFLPALASANVVINEVAWMGTEVSSSDEWIELYNDSNEGVNLDGWVLGSEDGSPSINLSGVIAAGSFFLLERTDDTSVPDVSADLIYTGALLDSGEILILKNNSGNEVDKIDASGGWPAGDKVTKETMQKSGSAWITATGTPKAQNREQETASDSGVSADSGWPEYVPPEQRPDIKVYAGEDKTMIVGASEEFRGEAFAPGGDLLENGRYLWNFGDGVLKEGQNIAHFYQYPGNYVIILDVSVPDYYSRSDSLKVKVVPNEVFISEVKTGVESFIELSNESKREINISGWRFVSGNQSFTFSKNSCIGPGSYLVIPITSSGVLLPQGSGSIQLLYIGGFQADIFNYVGELLEHESFSRVENGSVITSETPGAKNVEPKIGSKKEIVQIQTVQAQKTVVAAKEMDGDLTAGDQTAGVVTAAGSVPKRSNTLYYFLASCALVIFAGSGVLFIRRKSGL